MLQDVKLRLRISHSLLDSDIAETIEIARAEMIRSGVSSEYANSNHPLIKNAIKTYCCYIHGDDEKKADGYLESWLYQLDNLRKSTAPELEEGDADV